VSINRQKAIFIRRPWSFETTEAINVLDSATERICLISTVKAPALEIKAFANYHINIGVDRIILFFDDPNDQAIGLFVDDPNILCIKCDDVYWSRRDAGKSTIHNILTSVRTWLRLGRPETIERRQEVNVNYGLEIAKRNNFHWIIQVDSDELLFIKGKGDVHEILRRQPLNVVRFHMKEAVPERDFYKNRFEATLFREPTTDDNKTKIALVLSKGCEGAFFYGEYFRGHAASKVAVRTRANVKWLGIHGPARPKIPEAITDEIILLHYDCVGFADWRTKWARRVDQTGKAVRIRRSRRRQLALFREVFGVTEKELALYRRMHMIRDKDKVILSKHGLLTRIKLDKKLFDQSA
jgi:hypothetical protein